MVDKYQWVDVGSSYLPSELQAAYLWGQLGAVDDINQSRLAAWRQYYETLRPLETAGKIELPSIPDGCEHNAHMFYIKAAGLEERTALLDHLKADDILAVFHYVPLHTASAGQRFARFEGQDRHTTRESERLVRLPLWYGISASELACIINSVFDFYSQPPAKEDDSDRRHEY